MNVWKNSSPQQTSTCNMINGTDSANFSPYRKPEGTLSVWATDICRSTRMIFKRQSEFKGIPSHRYEIAGDFLNEIGPEYSTDCFCVNKIPHSIVKPNGCLYKGALDLSLCVGKRTFVFLIFLIIPKFINFKKRPPKNVCSF